MGQLLSREEVHGQEGYDWPYDKVQEQGEGEAVGHGSGSFGLDGSREGVEDLLPDDFDSQRELWLTAEQVQAVVGKASRDSVSRKRVLDGCEVRGGEVENAAEVVVPRQDGAREDVVGGEGVEDDVRGGVDRGNSNGSWRGCWRWLGGGIVLHWQALQEAGHGGILLG